MAVVLRVDLIAIQTKVNKLLCVKEEKDKTTNEKNFRMANFYVLSNNLIYTANKNCMHFLKEIHFNKIHYDCPD